MHKRLKLITHKSLLLRTPAEPVLAHNKEPRCPVSLYRTPETVRVGKQHALHEKGTRKQRDRVVKTSGFEVWAH